MKTLVRIIIISDDTNFVKRLKNLVDHPQVSVECTLPKDDFYDFCVVGGSTQIVKILDKIKTGIPIYLSGTVCDDNVPIRKVIKCNIVDCLESEESLRLFVKEVSSLCKQKIKIREASCKLDSLRSGDLKNLLKKSKSDKFVDYIQNHPLPMVLVSREYEILHANKAMEDLIGIELSGISADIYWHDREALEQAVFDLKEKSHILGRDVTLKNANGDLLQMKLYTSLHCDENGEWLNTRCLFVPIDQILPE